MNFTTKQKTLYYRRAAWLAPVQDTLEGLLRAASERLTTTADRTFNYIDGEMQGMTIEAASRGLLLHVALYVPNQSRSTVPNPSRRRSSNANTEPPPEQHSFMDGDIFFLVNGNHIVLCPSGAREAVAIEYMESMLKTSGLADLVNQYKVVATADANMLALIHREGVKKINFDATLYDATMKYNERKTTQNTFLNTMKDEFFSLLSSDADRSDAESDMENLSVAVELKNDRRARRGRLASGPLDSIARSVIEDEDEGFKIVTGSGKELTRQSLRVRKRVTLPVHGSSVFRSSAFQELENYFRELESSGMLQQ